MNIQTLLMLANYDGDPTDSTSCLLLPDSKSVKIKGRVLKPAKALYEHYYGRPDKTKYKVYHTCGKSNCIRKEHLTIEPPKTYRYYNVTAPMTKDEIASIDQMALDQGFNSRAEYIRAKILPNPKG